MRGASISAGTQSDTLPTAQSSQRTGSLRSSNPRAQVAMATPLSSSMRMEEGAFRPYRARMFSSSESFVESMEKLDLEAYSILPTVPSPHLAIDSVQVAYTGFLEIDVPFEDIHRSLHIATRIVARFPLPVRQRLKLGQSPRALESRDRFQIYFACF